MWKGVSLTDFAIFLKSVAKHRYFIFSNNEVPYDNLQKHLNSAVTKLLYSLSDRIKNGTKRFYDFCCSLNLYNLSKIAYNHIKLNILWK